MFLTLIAIFGCKREFKETIETFPNGQVKIEFIYSDQKNKDNYTIIHYYENGQIKFKGTVKNKKFIGEKLNYYENGNFSQIDSIISPCELDFCCCDGKVTRYYSNGELNQTFENRDGVANGLVTLYDDDSSGVLNSIYVYKDGEKNGVAKKFYSSGKLFKLSKFKNDTLVDKVYYFEESGDTMKIYNTWKGNEDFPTKKWLTNGQIFYAEYIDSSYNIALYRWTDKNGKELRREVVENQKSGEWVSKDNHWLTPN